MDSDNDLVIQELMQHEANAYAGDDERLMIIFCLLRLQAQLNALHFILPSMLKAKSTMVRLFDGSKQKQQHTDDLTMVEEDHEVALIRPVCY